ncbi:SPOR domain-containing protein [Pseudahrensia aquimaris]|uniref:SPOR domain-containing protein n=1 Tax=Pseudahrensia aquimaris TaxID=744461 RepID=A0ABW3FHV8_9HYPH
MFFSKKQKPDRKGRTFFTSIFTALLAAALILAPVADADAKKRKSKGNPKYAAYVIDAKTGKVLFSRNGNAKRYPASLTKMMTLYIVFEEMRAGRLKKSSRIKMTRNAAKRPPSKLGVRPGQSISLQQAILSLVTKSANDVSTAIAEHISGSEPAFARRMTLKARQLGMKSTTFKNANGLTARGQLTTAADMAKLGLALREHFPRKFSYFKTRSFKFGKRRMGNHNKLLGRVRGVDGIKTGYTRASGFNLVSSVSHGGRKIVAVVMGGRSGRSRNAHMKKLIGKYLPKASRGNQRRLVARFRSSSNVRTAKLNADARKAVNKRVVAAHTTPKKSIKDVANKVANLKKSKRPTPDPRPSTEEKAPKKVIDSVVTASVATMAKVKPSGWQIQLAASDKRERAEEVLKTAQIKNPKMLRGMAAYTEKVVRDGNKLYRARMSGFESQSAANSACKVLKKQDFRCIALKL